MPWASRRRADVAVNDRKEGPALQAVLAEVRELGRQPCRCPGTLLTAECERIVAAAIEALGQIDILISNPAYTVRAPFLEYDPEAFMPSPRYARRRLSH